MIMNILSGYFRFYFGLALFDDTAVIEFDAKSFLKCGLTIDIEKCYGLLLKTTAFVMHLLCIRLQKSNTTA